MIKAIIGGEFDTKKVTLAFGEKLFEKQGDIIDELRW